MLSSFNTILLSLLGGVLPALLWLWFWLKEDRLHPEPKSRIMLSFISGMLAVFPAIWTEKSICGALNSGVCAPGGIPGVLLVVLWAMTEEIFKYLAAFFSSFWKNRHHNEPIDAIIYLITVALGFSALENALFIFNPIGGGFFLQSIMTGNSRFLGATLLHVASSAAIGVLMGLAYYKKASVKKVFLAIGLSIAVLLHAVFNLLIIKLDKDLFFIFSGVWVLIVLLILLIEKVRKVNS